MLAAKEGLSLTHSIGDAETLVWLFVLLGGAAARRGEAEIGATLVGVSDALSERVGLSLTGVEAELHSSTVESLHGLLLDEAFESRLAEGRGMSVDEGVEFALTTLN